MKKAKAKKRPAAKVELRNAKVELHPNRRIVAEIPHHVYRKLRMHSVDRGITMRALLIEWIKLGAQS